MTTRHNAFNVLRLLAAAAVLLSHSFALVGLAEPQVARGVKLGTFGVFMFFAMSGYLVWLSLERNPNVMRFAAHRALRIYPGLTVAVLFCAVALGPVVTRFAPSDYFQSPDVAAFVLRNASGWVFRDRLPGVFTENPFPHAVNGSLWTIPYELLMYAGLCAIGLMPGRWRIAALWTAAAGLALGLCIELVSPDRLHRLSWLPGRLGFDLGMVCALGGFFLAGALFAAFRRRVRFTWRGAAVAAIVLAAASPTAAFVLLAWVALTYLLLFVAFADGPLVERTPRADYSYGIYLYAFPVQQTVAWFGFGPDRWLEALLVSSVVTFAFAALSWRLVESPALRLKRFIRHAGSGPSGATPPAAHAFGGAEGRISPKP